MKICKLLELRWYGTPQDINMDENHHNENIIKFDHKNILKIPVPREVF